MNISLSNNSLSFGKVYAIAGTQEQISKIKKIYDNSSGDVLCLVARNKSSRNSRKSSNPTDYVKKIALIIVGKKDVEKVKDKHKGWKNIRQISTHVEKFADLTTVLKK